MTINTPSSDCGSPDGRRLAAMLRRRPATSATAPAVAGLERHRPAAPPAGCATVIRGSGSRTRHLSSVGSMAVPGELATHLQSELAPLKAAVGLLERVLGGRAFAGREHTAMVFRPLPRRRRREEPSRPGDPAGLRSRSFPLDPVVCRRAGMPSLGIRGHTSSIPNRVCVLACRMRVAAAVASSAPGAGSVRMFWRTR